MEVVRLNKEKRILFVLYCTTEHQFVIASEKHDPKLLDESAYGIVALTIRIDPEDFSHARPCVRGYSCMPITKITLASKIIAQD